VLVAAEWDRGAVNCLSTCTRLHVANAMGKPALRASHVACTRLHAILPIGEASQNLSLRHQAIHDVSYC